MVQNTNEDFFKSNVLGHPAGLFVLFFTEMWERFSYYGMRALLVLFLTSTIAKGGWAWSVEDALALYGTYTMSVYFTPVVGGFLADRYLGYRWAVIFGAFAMTLGHASMAVETPLFLYIGIGFLIIGNGLFKPNMTSIISYAYEKHPEKKDGAYSLYYMGVNAGAFLGIMLCGYIGEKISWSWGFGLAGIFMFFGMLQFYFTQNIFGEIGLKPTTASKKESKEKAAAENTPANIIRDRIIAVLIFSVFTIFFWAAFEQAGGSMTIFADKYTQRELFGTSAFMFKIADALLTIIPLLVISYVLIKLFKQTFKKYALGNIILATSFVIIWGIVLWKVGREYAAIGTEVPATWFGILNSLFIVCFAPAFSKWWESKYNLSGPMKFGLGMTLLGLGFGFLAYGSMGINPDSVVRVSMFWLIAAYLFHTLGELCISPVGLSYVSKLVPATWIGIMFGVYYLFIGMGNKIAGSMGGMIETISTKYSLSTFFMIFTVVSIGIGIIMVLLTPLMKKLMHGVK
ncbi:peptide MFS transporter [Flavobacterium frigoris]|uniref:Proton-dependent oligopeptide transporter, POT family n=1 Tax=Flavobacterium frigoris TaxID=229204 RepID=A0A1H9DSF9_FLAFI|nr:peptide MFS transporter [Flavobacterium frigoris]SEQ15663.1 proton-dependent oligopeptide transporter, POT family [Flavobacterium frigoris]